MQTSSDNQIQGWFDFANIYNRMVDECPERGTIIEIGVWKGASLCYLAQRAKDSGKNLRIIGLDNWRHFDWDGYNAIQRQDKDIRGDARSPLQQCKDNLKARGLERACELMEGDSIEAASRFADNSVNFIFVDDTHNAPHVYLELQAWLPKIIRPGWIAGHDYPGNIKAGVDAHFPHAIQDGNSWIGHLL